MLIVAVVLSVVGVITITKAAAAPSQQSEFFNTIAIN